MEGPHIASVVGRTTEPRGIIPSDRRIVGLPMLDVEEEARSRILGDGGLIEAALDDVVPERDVDPQELWLQGTRRDGVEQWRRWAVVKGVDSWRSRSRWERKDGVAEVKTRGRGYARGGGGFILFNHT
jgi:hypothetical protein